jgi:predicted kinase
MLASGGEIALERRVWRGHVRTLFPAVEQVRQAFVHRYLHILEKFMPFEKVYYNQTKIFNDPQALEIADICRFLRNEIPRNEHQVLNDFSGLRRCLAHMEACTPYLIQRAADGWRDICEHFPDASAAWDWPRCGQRLTLLVGPSGAGKSTYAMANYASDDIISSDAIREQLFGSIDMAGDQSVVFARLRASVLARLSLGQSAVIDATNLRREQRLENARLAPHDIPVEYVLIDRPISEKIQTAGWRNGKPGLIEEHSALFEIALPDLQRGDGLPNVIVVDRRVS